MTTTTGVTLELTARELANATQATHTTRRKS